MKYDDKQKNDNIKFMAKKLVSIAKEKKQVKPLEDAFRDVPTDKENHKGKLNYYN